MSVPNAPRGFAAWNGRWCHPGLLRDGSSASKTNVVARQWTRSKQAQPLRCITLSRARLSVGGRLKTTLGSTTTDARAPGPSERPGENRPSRIVPLTNPASPSPVPPLFFAPAYNSAAEQLAKLTEVGRCKLTLA